MKFVLFAAWVFVSSPVLLAQVHTIDFEQFHSGGWIPQDVSDPLVIRDVGNSGIDVTFQAVNGDLWAFDREAFSSAPPNASLFANRICGAACGYPHYISISFSVPVQSVSLVAGDTSSDWDSPLQLTALDSNGALVDDVSVDYRVGEYELLAVSGAGIMTVLYSSGGVEPCSTFIDDVSFSLDSGPKLYVASLQAGSQATVTVTDATPGGQVLIGYSLVGGGPTTVSLFGCGPFTVFLTNPQLLATGTAQVDGSFSYTATVPSSAAGSMVWFHAFDLAGCEPTTNGYVRLVH